jgi:hypothetical protein
MDMDSNVAFEQERLEEHAIEWHLTSKALEDHVLSKATGETARSGRIHPGLDVVTMHAC